MPELIAEIGSRASALIFIMMAISAGLWLLLYFSGLTAFASSRLTPGSWKTGTIMAAGAGVIFAMFYAIVTAIFGLSANAGAASAILTLLVLGYVVFARNLTHHVQND